MSLFLSLFPQTPETVVPPVLTYLLLHPRPDWGSTRWTRLFEGLLTTQAVDAFWHQFGLTPFPLSETVLCHVVAFLFAQSLSARSICCYLSALRYSQISLHLPDPSLTTMPVLAYVMQGSRRLQAPRRPHHRLPITPSLLLAIHNLWSQSPPSFDRTMLWAAFCLAFFGFMCAGEFTCSSVQAVSPLTLSARDMSVDSHSAPTLMAVVLRQSKTDQFGAGVSLFFDRIDSPLCPVAAVLSYLAVRPSSLGPLFVFSDGTSLSRPRLVSALRQVLSTVGVLITVATAFALVLLQLLLLLASAMLSYSSLVAGSLLRTHHIYAYPVATLSPGPSLFSCSYYYN